MAKGGPTPVERIEHLTAENRVLRETAKASAARMNMIVGGLADFGIRVEFDSEGLPSIDVSGFHLHDGSQ